LHDLKEPPERFLAKALGLFASKKTQDKLKGDLEFALCFTFVGTGFNRYPAGPTRLGPRLALQR
jgi:hypothetical protein